MIVENVVDAAQWIMWPAWLMAMDCLGYDHRVVYLNSMHAQPHGLPAPQSRDGKTALPADEPLRTQTARNETAMVVPLRTHGIAAPTTNPLKTFVAGNVGQRS